MPAAAPYHPGARHGATQGGRRSDATARTAASRPRKAAASDKFRRAPAGMPAWPHGHAVLARTLQTKPYAEHPAERSARPSRSHAVVGTPIDSEGGVGEAASPEIRASASAARCRRAVRRGLRLQFHRRRRSPRSSSRMRWPCHCCMPAGWAGPDLRWSHWRCPAPRWRCSGGAGRVRSPRCGRRCSSSAGSATSPRAHRGAFAGTGWTAAQPGKRASPGCAPRAKLKAARDAAELDASSPAHARAAAHARATHCPRRRLGVGARVR